MILGFYVNLFSRLWSKAIHILKPKNISSKTKKYSIKRKINNPLIKETM